MVNLPSPSHIKSSLNNRLKIPLTEGWLELFLTPTEKAKFGEWDKDIDNKSLTNKLTAKYFLWIAKNYVPSTISPNMITLIGFGSLAQAFYIAHHYGTDYPTACSWFSVVSILLFFVTSGVDVQHAEVIRQKNGLNELFKYSVDSCSLVFLSILATFLLGGDKWTTQWYAVQTSQLLLFTKHLSAFDRKAGIRYNILTGPGEVVSIITALLCLRASFGLEFLIVAYETTFAHCFQYCSGHFDLSLPTRAGDAERVGADVIRSAYYIMFATATCKCLLLKREHAWTRFSLSLCLLIRIGPALIVALGIPYAQSRVDVVADGFFMNVLITDVAVAKMAGREIHPTVVLMSFAMMLSHSVLISLILIYYIAVFGDLAHYLNLPLLSVCQNVYCDGVYDLCHIGHKNLFKAALSYGNRLYVGVCGDADCSTYKRPPIMTHDERCAEVAACKAVTKVIENAPCFGITQEFIDKHQIHVVAFGQEYQDKWPDPKDDIYYGYVRKIGIAKPMPRTPGLSTSDLIRRIQNSQPADVKKSAT